MFHRPCCSLKALLANGPSQLEAWGAGGEGAGPTDLGRRPLRPRGERTTVEAANLSSRLGCATDQQRDLGSSFNFSGINFLICTMGVKSDSQGYL